mgnify:CR=1 FL=1
MSCTAEPELDLGPARARSRKDVVNTARTLQRLATDDILQGDYERAESLNRQAVTVLEDALPADDVELAAALRNLAFALRNQQKHSDARQVLLRALQIYQRAGDPDAGDALVALAMCSDDQGDQARADELYREALAIQREAYGPNSSQVTTTLLNQAAKKAALENYSQAESLYRTALPKLENLAGPRHFLVGHTLEQLARVCEEQGKVEEAQAIRERAAKSDPAPHESNVGEATNSPGGSDR